MKYNEPKYNEQGLVRCEICGEHFSRVMTHVRQAHQLDEREYKLLYGFKISVGLTSQQSHDRSSKSIKKAFRRYSTRGMEYPGKETRFNIGHKTNLKK